MSHPKGGGCTYSLLTLLPVAGGGAPLARRFLFSEFLLLVFVQ